ncbi:MAG: alpha/beta fold hydrolase [Ignavibacterium sp.]|nr:MAG: alpha/beta fold hydrolase [Ignavibacterium sp.]
MKNILDLSVFTTGNKDNPPVLFIHGFPFDHYMWDEQVKKISRGHYCITYDVRGLGSSPRGDGQFTMESFVDDLENIIDNLSPDKPTLCGLSMGGYISLRAVERMEEKLSALILCDTKSLADTNEGKVNRARGIKQINEEGADKFVEQFISNCFAEKFKRECKVEYETIVNSAKSYDAVGLKGCLLAMAGRTDTTSYLSKISIPTLVICGEEDNLTPPEVMKSMSDKIRNSIFVTIKGAGHLSPVEEPVTVNAEIEKFLNK